MIVNSNYTWLFLVFALCSCNKKEDKLFRLLDSRASGIEFENTVEFKSDQNIIDYLYFYNGGGISAGDINNDGLIDIFFTANQNRNRLYLNKGSLQFEDISETAGISNIVSWSTGTTMADVNGDGYLDIYVCNVGNYKSFNGTNKLYINNGNNTFTESATVYGLDFSGFSTQASFFDFDRDGDLDMYLLNHSVHTPRSYGEADSRTRKDTLSGDRLFENLISEGQTGFKDITEEAGIYSSAQGFGLGIVTSDINQDGWMDIYVGNDFHENDYLYINNGDGSFSERISEFIQHTSRFSMGVDIADLNNDNLPDILSLDMLPRDPDILLRSGGEDMNQVLDIKLDFGYEHQYARNALQINKGDNSFAELATLTEVYATDWSWSTLINDYNNDGHPDIFISNGIYKRPNDLDYINYININQPATPAEGESLEYKQSLFDQMPGIKIPNCAFAGMGSLRFKEVAKDWGLDQDSYSNGAVSADLDNDGDLDLVVNNVNQKAFVYENLTNLTLAINYIKIQLEGEGRNKFAIGSRVSIYADGATFHRELTNARGFQSSAATELHFGLGAVTAIDSVHIIWPDGKMQSEKINEINTTIKIQKSTDLQSIEHPESAKNLITLDFVHQEDEFADYNYELLIPHKLSTEGPALAFGDVNNDGIEDIYLGGAHEQSGSLMIGNEDGTFTPAAVEAFIGDAFTEDVDAAFFDLEGDDDLDLYVVSGGNKYPERTREVEDRIYINDGKGRFTRLAADLPSTNGACVAISDFDADGISEIFVGARAIPRSYGVDPSSFLFKVVGTNVEVLQEWKMGMTTDATWGDIDNDADDDLVVVGEWMPVQIFENSEGQLSDETEAFGLDKNSTGWWNCITLADLNKDGLNDLIVGNLGLNTKLNPTEEHPVQLFLDDFDQNGQTEPIIFFEYQGASIPLATKDELVKQIPELKKKFTSYKLFSDVRSIEDVVGKTPSIQKEVQEMASSVFINRGNRFDQHRLPFEAQWSPVQDVLAVDINKDGHLDLIVVGNFHGALAQLGRQDASTGGIFINDGEGQFTFDGWLPLPADQEFRHVDRIGDNLLFVPNNNAPSLLKLDLLN